MSNRLPPERKSGIVKRVSFKPLNEDTWDEFVKLFGDKGACAGCWCMYWRLRRSEYVRNKGSGNKGKIKKLVRGKSVPGLLMSLNGKVAGWCSVAPREDFLLLENSRVLARVDDQPVWSVVCFFIAKEYRRQGYTLPFLQYVIDYCRRQGAKIVEAYPLDVTSNNYPATFAYVGFASSFLKAGFKEVERRSATRPIMRYIIDK